MVDDNDDDESEDNGDSTVMQIRNVVYFHAPVSRDTIVALLQKLNEAATYALTTFGTKASVTLFIHSEGGDAHAGLSGMDHIQNCRVPVTTVADGFVASAATFLLLGGHTRLAMCHSTVLIHQLSTAFWGKYAELVDEMQNSHQLMQTIRILYKKTTKLRNKQLNSILQKELTITAKECVTYGIVSGMYES